MKRLLILFCFVTLWSCRQDFKGGYEYNQVIDDSLNIEKLDSFQIENIIKIGPKISDTLIVK